MDNTKGLVVMPKTLIPPPFPLRVVTGLAMRAIASSYSLLLSMQHTGPDYTRHYYSLTAGSYVPPANLLRFTANYFGAYRWVVKHAHRSLDHVTRVDNALVPNPREIQRVDYLDFDNVPSVLYTLMFLGMRRRCLGGQCTCSYPILLSRDMLNAEHG